MSGIWKNEKRDGKKIKFYTEKCGFCIGDTEMDGNVKVVNFYKERE